MERLLERPGPRPIVTIAVLVLALLLLGALFAAIRVFLLPDLGLVHEEGSLDTVFCRVDDCEAALVTQLANASDVVCAFYEFDLPATAAELNAIDARVLVFEENLERARAVGLEVRGVPSTGLMHHKFCVLDGTIVITGSMNPTLNAKERNDEHLLIIRSRTLARAYTREWEVLAARADGVQGKKPIVDAPLVDLSGSLVDVCFSPAEGCERDLVRAIDSANRSIRFLAFSFTADPVGEALLRAHDRGVDVSGVFERRSVSKWSEYAPLRDAGVAVALDNNPGTMHHKVFVIDDDIVVTGSYNPTASADTKNDENLLAIDDPALAQAYLREWARINATATS